MSINHLLPLAYKLDQAAKRVQKLILSDLNMTPRDLITLLKRYDYLRSETAYVSSHLYEVFHVDSNMFNSDLSYIQFTVVNHNKRFVLKFEANCNSTELRLALKLADQIARSFYSSDRLLGTSFQVTGGGIELHCANLRELQSVACRTKSAVLFFIKQGAYNG